MTTVAFQNCFSQCVNMIMLLTIKFIIFLAKAFIFYLHLSSLQRKESALPLILNHPLAIYQNRVIVVCFWNWLSCGVENLLTQLILLSFLQNEKDWFESKNPVDSQIARFYPLFAFGPAPSGVPKTTEARISDWIRAHFNSFRSSLTFTQSRMLPARWCSWYGMTLQIECLYQKILVLFVVE